MIAAGTPEMRRSESGTGIWSMLADAGPELIGAGGPDTIGVVDGGAGGLAEGTGGGAADVLRSDGGTESAAGPLWLAPRSLGHGERGTTDGDELGAGGSGPVMGAGGTTR